MNVRTLTADTPGTLLDSLTAGADMRGAIRVGAVALFAVMTAAASQISVPLPFTPVPLTLTPLVVLLGGAVLGARLGLAAQVVYLTAGMAGLPVFAASAVLPQGALRLLGPTGGYLMAYPVAAFVAGSLAERGFDRRYLTSVLAMCAGLAVIFASGVTWLALFAQPAASGFDVALRTGFYPFLPADIVKVCVAAAVMPGIWKLTGRNVNPWRR
jgi:biotin transport system substrate-specific component